MNEDEIIKLIAHLASHDKYIYKKHARIQQRKRHLTDQQVKDILVNVKRILRVDNNNNIDGITSYKIEGGTHNHRLAIKFHEQEHIIIITVMDNERA